MNERVDDDLLRQYIEGVYGPDCVLAGLAIRDARAHRDAALALVAMLHDALARCIEDDFSRDALEDRDAALGAGYAQAGEWLSERDARIYMEVIP